MEFVPEQVRGAYAEILMERCVFEDNAKAASDIAAKRDELRNGLRRKEIIQALSNPELSADEKQALSAELKELLKKNNK